MGISAGNSPTAFGRRGTNLKSETGQSQTGLHIFIYVYDVDCYLSNCFYLHCARSTTCPLTPSSLNIMRQMCPLLLLAWVMAISGSSSRLFPTPPRPDSAMQQKFEDIYKDNIWGTVEENGGSGLGSNLAATQYTMSCIRAVVNKFELNSLADVPCGGMHWMPTLLRDLRDDIHGFSYLGIDIARSKPTRQSLSTNHGCNLMSWISVRLLS